MFQSILGNLCSLLCCCTFLLFKSVILFHIISLYLDNLFLSHQSADSVSLSMMQPESLNRGIHWWHLGLELLFFLKSLQKAQTGGIQISLFLFVQLILTHHDVGIFSSGFLFAVSPTVHKGLSYSVRQRGIINFKYQQRVDWWQRHKVRKPCVSLEVGHSVRSSWICAHVSVCVCVC